MRGRWFLLPLVLAACGGKSATSQGARPDASPPAQGVDGGPDLGEAPVLFIAERDGQYFAIAARADTGAVTAFGPAMPISARTHDVQIARVSTDGKRIAVNLFPKVGTADWTSADSFVLLGDGTSWTTLAHGNVVELSDASNDLSLIVTAAECPASSGDSNFTRSVIRADGTHLHDDGNYPCTPGQNTRVGYLAPDGEYVVLSQDATSFSILHRDGHEVMVAPAGLTFIRTFATSLLLSDGFTKERWIDSEGRPIDVPGFPTSSDPQTSTLAGLPIIHGVIYELVDRGIRPLMPAPAGVDPETIRGVHGNYVFADGKAPAVLDLFDATGTRVGSYSAAPARSAPPLNAGAPTSSGRYVAASASPNRAWWVFADEYSTPAAPGSQIAPDYERADDLWVVSGLDGAANPRTIPIRRASVAQYKDPSWASRDYVSSPSGAYVLYTEGTSLHAIDVDSGQDRALVSDFAITEIAQGAGAIVRGP